MFYTCFGKTGGDKVTQDRQQPGLFGWMPEACSLLLTDTAPLRPWALQHITRNEGPGSLASSGTNHQNIPTHRIVFNVSEQ